MANLSSLLGTTFVGAQGPQGETGLQGPTGANTYVGTSPPVDAVIGSFWLRDTDLTTFVLYDDGTSTQWVALAGVPGSSGPGSFGVSIEGGGSVITPGVKGYVSIPYNCTITGWALIADQEGDLVIDVWKNTYENYPPIAADSITGLDTPALVGSIKNQNLTVMAWSTAILAGDIIGFNVVTATNITRAHLTIYVLKD